MQLIEEELKLCRFCGNLGQHGFRRTRRTFQINVLARNQAEHYGFFDVIVPDDEPIHLTAYLCQPAQRAHKRIPLVTRSVFMMYYLPPCPLGSAHTLSYLRPKGKTNLTLWYQGSAVRYTPSASLEEESADAVDLQPTVGGTSPLYT